jgi:guanylate kinase
MTRRGIILYGPPAAGKDTVTATLTSADDRIQLFHRLKAGGGRSSSYRLVDDAHIDAEAAAGNIAWENRRYGSRYAIDTPALLTAAAKHVPVVHLGQAEAIEAVQAATPEVRWLVVQLWCPREVAAARLTVRNPEDVAERLSAWDATERLPEAHLTLDTSVAAPTEAAAKIMQGLMTLT